MIDHFEECENYTQLSAHARFDNFASASSRPLLTIRDAIDQVGELNRLFIRPEVMAALTQHQDLERFLLGAVVQPFLRIGWGNFVLELGADRRPRGLIAIEQALCLRPRSAEVDRTIAHGTILVVGYGGAEHELRGCVAEVMS